MDELKIEVSKVNKCGAKHKVGDHFFVRGFGTLEFPTGEKFCMYALNSLIPFLSSKQRERTLAPGDWVKDYEELCCPDPNGIVFRISVLNTQE
ncbi:TIGR04076 family protein [candidate division CSSED10-310 bacterium]|uniref:TIGR04076 family protein n=1 Tax=candidate division CSSED10-310 bacterium TaxID=2855610 RepID=A0ABV6Z0Y1_UNCC1